MPIDFPNSPTNGDSFTSNDKTWQFNGSSWALVAGTASLDNASVTAAKLAANAVTSEKIAAGAVTAAKLGNDIQLTPPDGSITTAKVAANAITQAKLAANVTGITLTTTANRSTDIPSPFTAQFIFLTDTNTLQRWSGSAWTNVLASPPGAPTALSATVLSTTSVLVAFTPGASAGASTTNYKYALSTDGGSAYGEATAVDPADFTSPITISGLTGGQTYHIKLKAVTDVGDSEFSSATSVAVPALPSAPTSLSATPGTTTVSIAFTPGANGGSAITNYQYATSTNGGSTYSSFTALNPADATSPIEITGLTEGTAYLVKLKAVHAFGAGAESAAVSVTTLVSFTVDYLVVAGGGSSGNGGIRSAGSGAGGLRSTVTATGGGCSLETALSILTGSNYAVQVGNGGAQGAQANGGNSVFSTITSLGGGAAGSGDGQPGANGGCGGGAWYNTSNQTVGQGTACQGYGGRNSSGAGEPHWAGGGGGGAGSGGGASTSGGSGVAVSITGSSVTYSTGGNANTWPSTFVNANGAANTGNGASGSAAGGSGIVILRYPNTRTITLGAGLTGSTTTVSSNKVTTITAGSGNVSWS